MLAPYAYSQAGEYVDSIGKLVKEKIYANTMVQVDWPDGTLKNVNIDRSTLDAYHDKLTNHVSS